MNQQNNLPTPSPIEEMKIIYRVGVKIAGKWTWQDYDLPPPQGRGGSVHPLRRASDPAPIQAKSTIPAPRSPSPSMTMGRDPAKHLITFSTKFKGLTIEEADKEMGKDELAGFAEWGRQQIDPSPTLEVTCEMIEAYLIEREYVPTPKYKDSRRRS